MPHTPGPWAYRDGGEIYHNDGDVDPLIATVNMDEVSEGQARSDTRLIAASPDLLDVARMVISLHEVGQVGSGLTFDDVVIRARDLIAKVEG